MFLVFLSGFVTKLSSHACCLPFPSFCRHNNIQYGVRDGKFDITGCKTNFPFPTVTSYASGYNIPFSAFINFVTKFLPITPAMLLPKIHTACSLHVHSHCWISQDFYSKQKVHDYVSYTRTYYCVTCHSERQHVITII